MIIQSTNNLHLAAPKTRLAINANAGIGTFTLQNTDGFGSSWAIQIGETGHEQTEVLLLSGNPGAGTLGTTTVVSRFSHPADTPVYAIKYNQVVFERSTAGTAGTATPMTGGTITYQADSNVTQFDDTSGSASYAYRTYFRNSVLNVTTTESDWITSAGLDFYSLGKLRNRIKDKLWNAEWLRDEVLDDWINECKDIMVNQAIQTNENYALGTVNIGFGTDGLGTVTTADFGQIRRFWVTYDGNNKYQSTKMDPNDYLPAQTFSSTHPYHAWMGDNVFIVKPEGPGTAEVVFYRWGTTMKNDTDTLPLPMRPFTNIFVDYCKSNALSKDQKENESSNLMNRVLFDINNFTSSLSPRDKSGPTMIDLVEPIDGEDGFY